MIDPLLLYITIDINEQIIKITIPIAEAIPNCGLSVDVTILYKNVINKSVLPNPNNDEPDIAGPPPVKKKITLKLLIFPINCVIKYGPVTN